MPDKEVLELLRSIDISLQQIANSKSNGLTTAFINRKSLAQRLGVPTVAIDRLVHQGVVSNGSSGLVEGRHYCKLNPSDNSTNAFLYDAAKVLQDAWSNFKDYEQKKSTD
jgi:hypothetical protein